MRFTTDEVAAATSGAASGPPATVSGVETDSRLVRGGELFVPLRGQRDGHDWIAAALDAGAAAYLTERPAGAGSAVVVDDTMDALERLAIGARARISGTVVGITGSVGKTTTKDLALAVLRGPLRTHGSPASYNNEIGLPHTILNAPDDVEALVLEMGARRAGDIDALCRIAAPSIGVVTRVGLVHAEIFGSLEDVARAKSELVRSLPADGTAVLNADDPLVSAMASSTDARVLTVGAGAEVAVAVLDLDDELRPLVRIDSPWGRLQVRVPARGAHQAWNAGAAVAVGALCGVALDDAGTAIENARLSGMRMELKRGVGGVRILDDSYNANPVSMEAALRALAALDARRRVAVLGEMAELGDYGAVEHRRIGELTAELGVETLSIAAPAYGVDDLPDVAAAIVALRGLTGDDVVLVKGSRVAGLDRLVAALEGRP